MVHFKFSTKHDVYEYRTRLVKGVTIGEVVQYARCRDGYPHPRKVLISTPTLSQALLYYRSIVDTYIQ